MQRHQVNNTLLHQAMLEESDMQIEEERILNNISKNNGKDFWNDFAECINIITDMLLNSLQVVICLVILIVLFFIVF
ncbi:hypothetical protein FSDG_00784 [Fusobacterium animalis 7_1]|jgi:hypothetical protein|uniref:Uncharacterized protein n=1 Tax=Fusobacterium animalis 7_1 TaxID=457405 RepID=A0A140PPC3_9FUSO|nr:MULTISPECIES: hypothetical protein [Fusobacterium]AKC57544.1 hypothetical protein HMPREF1993_00051 [Fusobacterium phage Funu1]EEO42225.2 hypothetical protein FSDG_00784 [Fusobacterium animalis 7_1]EHG20127.2 hypothetical protein HMPREF9369_00195 [Fusobacterium polymorphum F0401]